MWPNRVATLLLAAAAICAIAAAPAAAVAAPTVTTETPIAVSYEQATLEGTVNPEGSPTSYWFEYGETTSYGTKVPVIPESIGSGIAGVRVSSPIAGLGQSTTYHFRVVAESEGETVKGMDAAFTTAGFNFSFAEAGTGNGQLSEPFGLAVDSKGNIWVSDTGNNRIQEFNEKGEYVSQFGKEGSGNGEFKAPKGIAIDPSGNIWVVDSGNNRVEKFNSKGEYLTQFGEKGTGEAQFSSPAGMTFSGTNAFIVDSGNNRVEKFALNTVPKYLAQFGEAGTGNGQFQSPTGVVVEASRIWITDTGNNRVEAFNASTLKYAKQFGKEGSGNGEFKGPAGIASDFQGKLWVVDSGNGRAEKFNIEGEYLDQFGEEGAGAGQLSGPAAIATSMAQHVLIVDAGNDRVQAWTVKAEGPDVIARLASELKASSVLLNANINPEALATSYWFEYGLTTAYGTRIPMTSESIGSGTSVVKVSQTASGLSQGTTYHFRAVAESAGGMVAGEDRTFKLIPPKATTEAATAVGTTQATLNAKVNPEGSATSYWFEYGPTTAYGTKIPISPESIGSGTTGVAVSQTPTGLAMGTEYHFRVVATSEVGTTNGEDKMFVTSP